MDDTKVSRPDVEQFFQGPHERISGFVSLKLRLHPTGTLLEFTQPDLIVGRHTEADVRLSYAEVSRKHCRLFFYEGCWRIEDLRSLNGIYVNGARVDLAPLQEGDVLRIGGVMFQVEQSGGGRPRNLEMLRSIVNHLP